MAKAKKKAAALAAAPLKAQGKMTLRTDYEAHASTSAFDGAAGKDTPQALSASSRLPARCTVISASRRRTRRSSTRSFRAFNPD